jgi:hypothetical protein
MMRTRKDTAQQMRWAPMVRRDKIKRLYETDAKGIVDETLIDDVVTKLFF